jgi:hypothetical protein
MSKRLFFEIERINQGEMRMTTQKQIDANRENAKRSTGPMTEAGKARSRLNSMTHGLTAEVLVTRDEEPDTFSELRDDLMEQYSPRTATAFHLVDRMAATLWRLRRAAVCETGIFDYRLEEVHEEARRLRDQEWQRRHDLREAVDVVQEEQRRGRGPEEAYEPQEEEELPVEDDECEEGDGEPDLLAQSIRLGDALTTDFGSTDSLRIIGRHETMLMNALTKTRQMLLEELESSEQSADSETQDTAEPPLMPSDCGTSQTSELH